MKKNFFLLILAAFAFSSCDENDTPTPVAQPVIDSIVSGAGYANDVYYSMENGLVKTQPRAEWNLAFSTYGQSISIHVNTGSKDSLFLWKSGALADFDLAEKRDNYDRLASNFDTTSWYNFSAFEQGRIESVVTDQGWGIYNTNTHDVTGDSVFILKLANGSMKKIAVLKRYSADYSFVFKIADLAKDAAVTEVTIAPGKTSTKNFIYYSVASNTIFDREPDKTEWDFVFTKWDSKIAGYPLVSGILTNEGIETAKIAEADSLKSYNDVLFSTKISNIGFDWKHFNGASYDISNPYYYIHALDGKYYRIKFISFDFMTGTTVFEKKVLQ